LHTPRPDRHGIPEQDATNGDLIAIARELGVRIRDLAMHALLRPSVAMAPFALASLGVERWVSTGSLWTFFAQVAVLMPIAGAGAWYLGMNEAERDRVSGMVRRFTRR
jgi:hypothetical protein